MSEPMMGRVSTSSPIPGDVEPARIESVRDVLAATPTAPVRRVEEWARLKKIPAWLLSAAQIGARWQCGEQFDPCLVTEAEFNAAVSFAANPYDTHNPQKG